MAKKRKNGNYATEKRAQREAERQMQKKRAKMKKILIPVLVAVVAVLVVAAIIVGLGFGLGWWKKTFTATHHATIEIEGYGSVHLELYGNEAPETVANFVKLANQGFYDGLTFHRIIEGFMAQGGDPNADGTGDSGTNLKGEFSLNGFDNPIPHERGTISMARGGNDYNSASCQFFIVHQTSESNSYSLDGKYAAFGKVTEGMEVIDAICESAEPTDNNGSIAKKDQPRIITISIHEAH